MRTEQKYWLAALGFCLLWIVGVTEIGQGLSAPALVALIVVGVVIASFISAIPYMSWADGVSFKASSGTPDRKA